MTPDLANRLFSFQESSHLQISTTVGIPHRRFLMFRNGVSQILVSTILIVGLLAACSKDPDEAPVLRIGLSGYTDGTIFIAEQQTSGVRCGAGFLETVHSRTFANQQDLEIWCGLGKDRFVLEFEQRYRPLANRARSTVANINGDLFDYESNLTYRRKRWGRGTVVTDQPIVVRWYQRTSTGYWAVVAGYKDCQGLSIVSERGYHGSVSGFESSMHFFQGSLIANLDYSLKAYRIGEPLEECRNLPERVLGVDPNWVYGMIPYQGHLVVGGTYQTGQNATLYLYDGKILHPRELKSSRQIASEYYSYLRWFEDLLIGTYPSGFLVKLSPNLALTAEEIPPLINESIGPFAQREAQSTGILKGRLLVGMYPWGLLYSYDPYVDSWDAQPLLPELLGTGENVPFESAYFKRERLQPGADPRMSNTEQRRRKGLSWDSWGFRLTSIAVFDGEVCVGTGNMEGVPYEARVHTHVPPETGKKYGDVFCAHVPDHSLISFAETAHGQLTFELYRDRFVVTQGDRKMRSVRLSEKLTAALSAEPFAVERGNGPYGRGGTNDSLGNARPLH